MRIVVAGVAAAVWFVLWDTFLMEPVLGSFLAAIPNMNAQPAFLWILIGDLVGGLVLAWVYDKTRSVFGSGLKGGATYGFYAGVLINFPLWLLMTVYLTGWPYRSSWALTIGGIFLTTVAGAAIGLVYERIGAKTAAA